MEQKINNWREKHAHTCICKLYTQYNGILCHTTVHEICSLLFPSTLPKQQNKVLYYNIHSKSCSENTQKKEEEKRRKRGKIRPNNGAFSSTYIETQKERERERKDTQQTKQRKGRERREMKNNGAFCFWFFISLPGRAKAQPSKNYLNRTHLNYNPGKRIPRADTSASAPLRLHSYSATWPKCLWFTLPLMIFIRH